LYFSDGQLFIDAPAVYGNDEGVHTGFFPNGKTAWRYNYVLDELHGLAISYYANGN
jgi:antitoxin component YwqK of YwqJK toxin-antitoxin module